MKKYKLQNKKHIINGITLYRIEALKNFADVRKGDVGGFVESERNLSQDGNCWIYHKAKVFLNSRVSENARVSKKAEIHENAHITGNAYVGGKSYICGNIEISGYVYMDGEVNSEILANCNQEKTIITGNIFIN